VDSAFGSARYDFLIKSSQVSEGGVEEYIINSEATSMRQSAEWGMCLLQSSFPRMKDSIFRSRYGTTRRAIRYRRDE